MCPGLITGQGGVDGMFTAGHFNEISALLIYEREKHPSLSLSGLLPSFLCMRAECLSLKKKLALQSMLWNCSSKCLLVFITL